MDGLTATRAIRELPAPKGAVPIIAVTANAMIGDREKYLAAGMDDYVAKPIDGQALTAAIARHTGAEIASAPSLAAPATNTPAPTDTFEDLDKVLGTMGN
jgi:DNA-binding response OmpR family regulator